jgi:hypothetical protein
MAEFSLPRTQLEAPPGLLFLLLVIIAELGINK